MPQAPRSTTASSEPPGLSVAAHHRLQRAGRAARRAPHHRRDPRSCTACMPPTSARPINPMQCRGQLDGAVAMGYGWALVENMVHDAQGHMVNPQLRNCRIPTFADTPHTDIFFADTVDSIGPLGAKSQGECGINPVAPAVSNALANATGVRFAHLPFTPDRLYARLAVAVDDASASSPRPRVRPERARGFRALAGRDQHVIADLPGLHRAAPDAAQSAAAGRLGDPAALRDPRRRPALAGLAGAPEAPRRARRRCWWAATTSISSRTMRALRAPRRSPPSSARG